MYTSPPPFFLTSWQFHGMRPGQNHSQLYVCHSLLCHGGGGLQIVDLGNFDPSIIPTKQKY